jgi:hypothetical protein
MFTEFKHLFARVIDTSFPIVSTTSSENPRSAQKYPLPSNQSIDWPVAVAGGIA